MGVEGTALGIFVNVVGFTEPLLKQAVKSKVGDPRIMTLLLNLNEEYGRPMESAVELVFAAANNKSDGERIKVREVIVSHRGVIGVARGILLWVVFARGPSNQVHVLQYLITRLEDEIDF